MTTEELDKKLKEALDNFSEEIRGTYEEYDRAPATKDDIHNLARHTFYALDTFRQEIKKYLDSNK